MILELALALGWKAAITSAVIVTVALVAERTGPVLAAILMGLPVSIGPALALIAYTQGEAFVAESARNSLASVLGVVGFLIGYVHASRWLGLWGCLLSGYAAWLVAALAIGPRGLTLGAALGLALAGLALGRLLLPRLAPPAGARRRVPRHFILVRGLLGGLVVGAVVTAARALGPSLAGFLASFPVVFGSAAWMLARIGDDRLAAATLSHADRGLPSFLAFCLTVAVLIEQVPVAAALAAGLALSALVSLALVALSRRASSAEQRLAQQVHRDHEQHQHQQAPEGPLGDTPAQPAAEPHPGQGRQ